MFCKSEARPIDNKRYTYRYSPKSPAVANTEISIREKAIGVHKQGWMMFTRQRKTTLECRFEREKCLIVSDVVVCIVFIGSKDK